MSVQVRRLRPEDWAMLREVRLAALLDAPSAFCSTYEQTRQRDEAGWRSWPSGGAAFVALVADKPVGMVGVGALADEPGVAELFAMWVGPDARGGGAADALVRAALAWARATGCTRVALEVAPGNPRAERFYARHGFAVADRPTTLPGGVAMIVTPSVPV